MRYYLKNNNSQNLIIFFAGWGCDENQFTNLQDKDDILILYGYKNLDLNFDFSTYKNINLIAYSAGVFIASILSSKLPLSSKKIAINGNPYLFDETFGISYKTVEIFKNINLENYLDFRRKYMVTTQDEFLKYNALESHRTIEDCLTELEYLIKLYQEKKDEINLNFFDIAIMAKEDDFFKIDAQKIFYKNKLHVISNAKHHIFFKFKSFKEILNYNLT